MVSSVLSCVLCALQCALCCAVMCDVFFVVCLLCCAVSDVLCVGVQYSERVEYYTAREQSYHDPENILCIIIDAMTETSTFVPLQSRESKGFGPATFKTALIGALVHGPEGFYGYTTNGIKGARITAEVLHRTLMKLKKTRKVWPKQLIVQLDNTSAENKNHTVMAYCAWLVATGVFECVQVRFLMVGHTHEDIDGYFGLLRRFLMKQKKGKATQTTKRSTSHTHSSLSCACCS